MIRVKDITEEIRIIEEELNRISDEIIKLNKKAPQGARLRAAKHGKVYQYFLRTKDSGINGIYLKKDNVKTAAVLAQIEYDEHLAMILRRELDALMLIKESWVDSPYILAKNKMAVGKRELVSLPYVSDESYITNWRNQIYEKLNFREGYPEYFTRQGLRVRSKSEVLIADMLDEMAIPYLYEKPLQLMTGTVHPDFTLLNIKERKELYWEHFGMMDEIEYRNIAFNKIRNYESSGLYQYDSVIWTYESGNNPINTRDLRKMIRKLKELLGY